MSDYESYLKLAKKAIKETIRNMSHHQQRYKEVQFNKNLPREMKAKIDNSNDMIIKNILKKTNIPILSEESFDENLSELKNLVWIVDPLDGTVNYVRKITNSAVSIALYIGLKPIFGVIGEYPSGKIIYGGPKIKSFADKIRIKTSKKKLKKHSILSTGFPSRYDFKKKDPYKLFKFYSKFLKIRMLGSAAISLTKVAEGSIDAYYEEEIMLWDVAAGLAILRGAGGKYKISKSDKLFSLRVYAHNGYI